MCLLTFVAGLNLTHTFCCYHSYNLTVIANDRGSPASLSSNLFIEVEVRDVNDNAPTIHNITSGVTTTTVPEV